VESIAWRVPFAAIAWITESNAFVKSESNGPGHSGHARKTTNAADGADVIGGVKEGIFEGYGVASEGLLDVLSITEAAVDD